MPPNVQHCYHAMALDECRAFFQLTRLAGTGVNEAGRLVEVWFRGVHSDIGGGNGNFGAQLDCAELDVRERQAPQSADLAGQDRRQPQTQDRHTDHQGTPVAVGPERNIRAADLLHSSVQLDPTVDRRQRNDPNIPLARIDDAGVITAAATAWSTASLRVRRLRTRPGEERRASRPAPRRRSSIPALRETPRLFRG